MIPFMIPMLMGAGLGAVTSKDPLKGALLGAGLGAAGGAFAPALAGAATPTAASTAGLLAPGASSAAGSQAAMLAAQGEGFGAIGQQMLAQAAGTKAPMSVNLMAGAQRAGELVNQARPFMDAASTAQQVQGMFKKDQQLPLAPTGLPNRAPMDLSGLMSTNQMGQLKQQRMARRGLLA